MGNFDDLPGIAPYSMVFDPGKVSAQTPYRYQVLRERARLKPCCYWREPEDSRDAITQVVEDGEGTFSSSEPFIYEYSSVNLAPGTLTGPVRTQQEIIDRYRPTPAEENVVSQIQVMGGWAHEQVPSYYITPITFDVVLINAATSVATRCMKAGAEQWHQGQDNFPPCNGAKTQCPHYTGPKFKYVKDEHLWIGEEILAEQVQELRSFMKNWAEFENPEEAWNRTFEQPDLFARYWEPDEANKDAVIVDSENIDGRQQPLSEMTRVHWDIEADDAVTTKVISTAEGTVEESNDVTSPPSFYTLIPNLGTADLIPITIEFPPNEEDGYETDDEDQTKPKKFTYEHSEAFSDIIFLAGTAKPQSLIYTVNTTIHEGFPFEESGLENSAIMDPKVNELIKRFFTENKNFGFRVNKVDNAGYWQEQFTTLLPGENKIVVCSKVDNQWIFARIIIDYKFYHMEFVQQGYKAFLVSPEISFIPAMASARAREDVRFKGYQMGPDRAEISSVYHFFNLEKDLIRICTTPAPDQRTFNITYEEVTENVKFYKIGRCNRFVCEIIGRDIPTVAPMGMDRSLQISKVTFKVVTDRDSGHGGEEAQEIEMEIPEYGRNIRGIAMPTRFFMVEPAGDVDIRNVDLDASEMEVQYFIFRAEPISEEPAEGRIEETIELLATFQDENFTVGNIGGLSIFNIHESEPASNLMHSPEIDGDNIVAGKVSKYDMSYVVEYKSESGNVIGRKWIYGVVEMSKYWARDVEIRYSWCSEFTTITTLIPKYRKFGLDVNFGDLDELQSYEGGKCRRTQCGDHETSSLGEGGPTFYPYDACAEPLYTNRDVTRWLLQEVPDAEPIDEKYRAPDRYRYATLEHHVFGFLRPDCFIEWTLGTITSYGARFNGWSRERGPISPFVRPKLWFRYIARGWKFPYFGNRGREAFRIFKSMHFRQYSFSCRNPLCGICVRLAWLPAVPFAGSSDFMQTNSPRTILDQTTTGDTLERKPWKEIFYIRNVLDPASDGDGRPDQPVQWPRVGFYPNFRKPEYTWAWAERNSQLERGENPILGVVVGKPTPTIEGEEKRFIGADIFTRPVNYYPGEDEDVTLYLVPEVYASAGTYEERAHFKLGEKGEKVYFNEYTGDIRDYSGPNAERKQIYAFEDKAELISSGINPSANVIYEDPVGDAGRNPPTDLEEANSFVETGNLIPDIENVDVYLSAGDITDASQDSWTAFFRALNIGRITPKYLPREEFNITEKEDCFPSIKITDFPNINPSVNLNKDFSNIFLPEERVRILGGRHGEMNWVPVLPTDPPGSEQIEGFVITVLFDRRVMLSKLKLEYQVYGGVAQDSPLPTPPAVPPSIDPSIRIVVTNTSTSEDIEVEDKPAYKEFPQFNPRGLEPIPYSMEYGEETFDNDDFYDRIEIFVGPRNDETGFILTLLDVSAKFITEAQETIEVKEAKYIVEVGENPENIPAPFNYPAQDDFEDKKWYLMNYAEDVFDNMEYRGINEFWQPARASLNKDRKVGSIGRLRRNWANGWDSLDIRIHLGEITFKHEYEKTVFGGDVIEDHENRQFNIIKDALENAIDDGLDIETLQMYISDEDRELYAFLQGVDEEEAEDITLPYEDLEIEFDAGLDELLGKLATTVVVPRGDKDPGWQAEGFWACLGDRAKTRIIESPKAGNCANLGGGEYGTSTPEWNTTHGVCGKNVGNPVNSDDPDYWGGISVGDLGFYQTRRLILSGGDVGRSFADPGFALTQFDGNAGSVQWNIEQDVAKDLIAAVGAKNFFDARGIPEPTQDIKEARQ